MSNFNKLNVKSAAGSRNTFDLSFDHLTTAEIGQIIPLANWDCIPGDIFDVKYGIFSRTAPLALPTFGDLNLKTVSAFVPYYQVMDEFDAWVIGKTVYRGKSCTLRTISQSAIASVLKLHSTSLGEDLPEEPFDILVKSYDDEAEEFITDYINLDDTGKYIWKVLNCLGYRIPGFIQASMDDTVITDFGASLNALPLLCFFKVVNDYMTQSALYDNSELTGILKDFQDGVVTEVDASSLDKMFSAVHLIYQPDYFTTAWQSPSFPLSTIVPPTSSVNNMLSGFGYEIAAPSTALTPDANQTFGLVQAPADVDFDIRQNDLDVLKAFDNWTRRNSYSGSRTIENIYSRYGVSVKDFEVEYADLIGSSSQKVSVGDVTSTAATDNAELGEYSGKAVVSDATGFNYKVSDFGQLIVLSFIDVKPIYKDGMDRQCLKTTALEFYQPEYDAVGVNAISQEELMVDPTNSSYYNSTFGFTERYNEYRCGKSKVTGDMNLARYVDAKQWTLSRDLTSIASNKLVAQNPAFMDFDGNEYNYIFSTNTEDNEDHFYLTSSFNVKAIRPIKSVDAATNLGEGSTTIHRNGNIVS